MHKLNEHLYNDIQMIITLKQFIITTDSTEFLNTYKINKSILYFLNYINTRLNEPLEDYPINKTNLLMNLLKLSELDIVSLNEDAQIYILFLNPKLESINDAYPYKQLIIDHQ